MGDAARELPHCLHLLGLHELLFERPLLGRVDQIRDQARALGGLGEAGEVELGLRSVARGDADLEGFAARCVLAHRIETRGELGAVRLDYDVHQARTRGGPVAEPGDRAEGGVAFDDTALLVQDGDTERRMVVQATEQGAAARRRVGRALRWRTPRRRVVGRRRLVCEGPRGRAGRRGDVLAGGGGDGGLAPRRQHGDGGVDRGERRRRDRRRDRRAQRVG